MFYACRPRVVSLPKQTKGSMCEVASHWHCLLAKLWLIPLCNSTMVYPTNSVGGKIKKYIYQAFLFIYFYSFLTDFESEFIPANLSYTTCSGVTSFLFADLGFNQKHHASKSILTSTPDRIYDQLPSAYWTICRENASNRRKSINDWFGVTVTPALIIKYSCGKFEISPNLCELTFFLMQ